MGGAVCLFCDRESSVDANCLPDEGWCVVAVIIPASETGDEDAADNDRFVRGVIGACPEHVEPFRRQVACLSPLFADGLKRMLAHAEKKRQMEC